MKFRKRPVVIEAVQFTREIAEKYLFDGEPLPRGVALGSASYHRKDRKLYSSRFVVRTLEGEMEATFGDWIITGVKGEVYPCKPDIFEQTYEKVEETTPNETTREAIEEAERGEGTTCYDAKTLFAHLGLDEEDAP